MNSQARGGPDLGRNASRKLHQSAQAPDRPQAGTEGEQQRRERQPDVVERGEGCEEGTLRVRRQQEDESGLRDLHDGLAEEALSPGLVYVHPCCGLQPERLNPDPPSQGAALCPARRRWSRQSRLVNLRPYGRLRPVELRPVPPAQGRTVCPPHKRQGGPAGLC